MPSATNRRSANTDDRLSQLIQLKRCERPDADFWRQFDQEFRSRQLSSLVTVQPMYQRVYRMCSIAARRSFSPTSAVAAVVVTLVAATNTSYFAYTPLPEPPNLDNESIAETEPTPDAFFVVQNEEAPAETVAPTLSPSSSLVYQLNVIAQPQSSSGNYQLNTAPVTFSAGATYLQPSETPLPGAKILSSQGQY